MKILCQQPQSSPTAPTRLLGKKTLCQQLGSPVGEGLLPFPTANGEAVGEADGAGTVWLCRGFINSFSFPTGTLLGKNPFANSRSLPSVLEFLAVGKEFFPDIRVFLLGKIFFANSWFASHLSILASIVWSLSLSMMKVSMLGPVLTRAFVGSCSWLSLWTFRRTCSSELM
jgi:hypothetical protein